ncbi:MAG: hypothetical protein ABII22_05875 [Candidatus Micrarchaeota archaeon]
MKTVRTINGKPEGPRLTRSAMVDQIALAQKLPTIFKCKIGGQDKKGMPEITKRGKAVGILSKPVPKEDSKQLQIEFEALLNSGNILVKPAIRKALVHVSAELGVKPELNNAIYIFGLKLVKMLKQPTVPGKTVVTRLIEELKENGKIFANTEGFGEINAMATKVIEKMMTQALFFGASFTTTQEIRSHIKPVEYAEAKEPLATTKQTGMRRLAEAWSTFRNMVAALVD